MSSLFLISLGKCIPILNIIVYIFIASNEWFSLVDANDFNDLSPLLCNIAFFISLNNCWFNMIVVVDSVGHLKVALEGYISGIQHIFFFVTHVLSYIIIAKLELIKIM